MREFNYQKLQRNKGKNTVEHAGNYFQGKDCLVEPEKDAEGITSPRKVSQLCS